VAAGEGEGATVGVSGGLVVVGAGSEVSVT
jgi:hypothetical protein